MVIFFNNFITVAKTCINTHVFFRSKFNLIAVFAFINLLANITVIGEAVLVKAVPVTFLAIYFIFLIL